METTLSALPQRTISLRPDVYDSLLRIAGREGKNVEAIADELLTETLNRRMGSHSVAVTSQKTFAEILAPLQQDFDEGGMTDDELADFIAGEVATHRKEQASKGE